MVNFLPLIDSHINTHYIYEIETFFKNYFRNQSALFADMILITRNEIFSCFVVNM